MSATSLRDITISPSVPVVPENHPPSLGLTTVRDHYANIGRLIAISVASAKVHELKIQEKHKIVHIRPQLHVILRAPTGTLKSTILGAIKEKTGMPIMSEITTPGLVGSIDSKTFQLLVGSAWLVRNSVLLLDEFRFRRRTDDWVSFLQLLEDQRYNRKLGMYSSEMSQKDGDLFVKLKAGQIEMKTRFSMILATMKSFQHTSSQEFRAFVNRCVPYEFDLMIEQIEKIIKGEIEFAYKEYRPDRVVTIRKAEYTRIVNFVKENMRKVQVSDWTVKENFARAVGDVCRSQAVLGRFDRRLGADIVRWKLTTYDEIGKHYARLQ